MVNVYQLVQQFPFLLQSSIPWHTAQALVVQQPTFHFDFYFFHNVSDCSFDTAHTPVPACARGAPASAKTLFALTPVDNVGKLNGAVVLAGAADGVVSVYDHLRGQTRRSRVRSGSALPQMHDDERYRGQSKRTI